MLEKTLETPLDFKDIKLVNPNGNQSWIFIGRTDTETKVPIFWPHIAKSHLIRKDPDAGKDHLIGSLSEFQHFTYELMTG